MAPTCEQEQIELSEKRAQLERQTSQSSEAHENIEKFIALIRKYTDVEELNAYILNELIEKIVVHEKTVDKDGTKSQQIDIYYKFVGNINMKKEHLSPVEFDMRKQVEAQLQHK